MRTPREGRRDGCAADGVLGSRPSDVVAVSDCTCQRYFPCAHCLGMLSEPKPVRPLGHHPPSWAVAGFGSESVEGHVLYAVKGDTRLAMFTNDAAHQARLPISVAICATHNRKETT